MQCGLSVGRLWLFAVPDGQRYASRGVQCVRCKRATAGDLDWATPVLVASAVVLMQEIVHPNEAFAALDDAQRQMHHGPAMEMYRLAENEDFWANMARYSRFFVSVMVGTAYTILKPFGQLLKKPVTAAFIVGGSVLMYFFISFTLKGMLGLEDLEL